MSLAAIFDFQVNPSIDAKLVLLFQNFHGKPTQIWSTFETVAQMFVTVEPKCAYSV